MEFPWKSVQSPTTTTEQVTVSTQPAIEPMDFSRWERPERSATRPEYRDLGLNSDQTLELLGNTFGLTDKLQEAFDFLTTGNGKPKAMLRLSAAFEQCGRDATYEQLSALTGTSCSNCYQQGLELRRAYEEAFGLHLTSTKEGMHITTASEVQIGLDRLQSLYDKHLKRAVELVGHQLETCQRTNQSVGSISGRMQALLTAGLMQDDDE